MYSIRYTLQLGVRLIISANYYVSPRFQFIERLAQHYFDFDLSLRYGIDFPIATCRIDIWNCTLHQTSS